MIILLLDDEKDVLEEMKYALCNSSIAREGSCEIYANTDYEEVLNKVSPVHYDLAITDMVMGVDRDEGHRVVERLTGSDTIVIVFTGFPAVPDCVRALRSGAWDYIEKNPADGTDPIARLITSCENACKQVGLRRTAAVAIDVLDADHMPGSAFSASEHAGRYLGSSALQHCAPVGRARHGSRRASKIYLAANFGVFIVFLGGLIACFSALLSPPWYGWLLLGPLLLVLAHLCVERVLSRAVNALVRAAFGRTVGSQ